MDASTLYRYDESRSDFGDGECDDIAVERLMGMVLVAISVQMLLDGITTYFKALS